MSGRYKQYRKRKPIKQKTPVRKSNSVINYVNSYPFTFSFIFNLLIFLVFSIVFTNYFETSDDTAMMMKVSGTSIVGHGFPHLHFTNVILGWILQVLYSFMPVFPWYGLYLISGPYVLYSVLFAIAIQRMGFTRSVLWLAAFLFMGGSMFIIRLQFTVTSWCYVFAGVFLLANNLQKLVNLKIVDLIKSPVVQAAFILILVGSMVRWKSFILAFVISVPLIIAGLRKSDFSVRRLIHLASLFAIICVTAFVLHEFSKLVYKSDPERKAFLVRKSALNDFIDFAIVENVESEAAREAIIESAGWTLNDYNMLVNWFYLNETLYSYENMHKIIGQIPRIHKPYSFEKLKRKLGQIVTGTIPLNLILVALLGLFLGGMSKRSIATLLVSSVIMLALSVMMIYYLKPPPERVSNAFFILLVSLPVLQAANTLWKSKYKYYLYGISALMGVFILTRVPDIVRVLNNTDRNISAYNSWFRQEIGKLNQNPDNLYIAWTASLPYELMLPFEDISYMKKFRSATTQYGSANRLSMAEFNINDPYYELVTDDRLYLITSTDKNDRQLTMFATYIYEHYEVYIRNNVILANEVFTVHDLYLSPDN